MEKISVAIQAGGMSSRMGSDKGLLQLGGISLVEYVLQQIQNLNLDVFIISNDPSDYENLGLPVFSDVYSGIGALGGIHTILTYSRSEYVLALACDMPFVNLDLINHMIGLCQDWDIVIPVLGDKGYLEPFRAIYSRRCFYYVEQAIHAGKRKVISYFDEVDVLKIRPDIIHNFDPDEKSFININTPDDYKKLVTMLEIGTGEKNGNNGI